MEASLNCLVGRSADDVYRSWMLLRIEFGKKVEDHRALEVASSTLNVQFS